MYAPLPPKKKWKRLFFFYVIECSADQCCVILVLTPILIWCLIDCWRNDDDNNSWIVPSAGTRNMLTLVSSFNNFLSTILFVMGRFLDHFFRDRNFSGQEFVPIIMTLTEWQQKRCISQRSNNLYRLLCQSESFWIKNNNGSEIFLVREIFFPWIRSSSWQKLFLTKKTTLPRKIIWKAATTVKVSDNTFLYVPLLLD